MSVRPLSDNGRQRGSVRYVPLMNERVCMPRGRKTALTIHLTADERQMLTAWQRSTTIQAGRAKRGGLFSCWPTGYRFPISPPRSGSAGALSTSGCSGFSTQALRGWLTNQDAVSASGHASRTGPEGAAGHGGGAWSRRGPQLSVVRCLTKPPDTVGEPTSTF